MSKFVLLYFLALSAFAAPADKSVKHVVTEPKTPFKASDTFYTAMDEFVNEKYKDAYRDFTKTSKNKNISKEEIGISLYNAALSLERNEKFGQALELYKKILNSKGARFLYKDAYYRASSCCHELKNWTCVMANLDNWKNTREVLSLVEEFEYRVRKGTAYYELKSYKDSINYLEPAVQVFDDKITFLNLNARNKGYPENKVDALGLWALEALADSYKMVGMSTTISLLPSNLDDTREQVELKAYYYVKAQDTYLEVLKHGDKETATKGLYLVGTLYEHAYKELLDTPIPDNIAKEHLQNIYRDNLKKVLQPLLDKSEIAHKKNLEFASFYKIDNSWTQKSRAALEKIKK